MHLFAAIVLSVNPKIYARSSNSLKLQYTVIDLRIVRFLFHTKNQLTQEKITKLTPIIRSAFNSMRFSFLLVNAVDFMCYS